jgi:hypothetical protein
MLFILPNDVLPSGWKGYMGRKLSISPNDARVNSEPTRRGGYEKYLREVTAKEKKCVN